MKKEERVLFIALGLLGSLIIGLAIFLFLNKDKMDANTHIIEVGQENSSYYCNIEYFDLEKVTTETVEKNRQKCTEAATKLFGTDKSEDVKIRYKKH